MRTLRAALAAGLLQLRLLGSDLSYLMPLVTVPFISVSLLAIVDHAGRPDLASTALLAPVLIALWALALYVSADIIDSERALGTLELAFAAPASFAVVLLSRIVAVTAISLLALVEALAVARVLFDHPFPFHHPLLLVGGLLLTGFAMSGTVLIIAAFFVHTRNARLFQNSLTYPFYILGCVMVPAALLPGWLQPLTKPVFLSWSADLLRASLRPEAPADPLLQAGMVVLLGSLGFVLGSWLLGRLLVRARDEGTLALW